MAVKKCCVENCNSCSTRKEDYGVTYHKFPKDETLHGTWTSITHLKNVNTDLATYVCSRHFCKSDFQSYKDSKYILKSDAVPSIFSWNISEKDTSMDLDTPIDDKDKNNSSTGSNESEVENVDAIKKFIEEQENEIKVQDELEKGNIDVVIGGPEEPLAVATRVMDMILSKSDANIANNEVKAIAKQTLSPGGDKVNNSMALSVGSKVEAKDFGEVWYPAEIIEVDYDEMEVLVHYELDLKKHDEWINVSSPRLRPIGSSPTKTRPPEEIVIEPPPLKEEPKEPKVDEKPKLVFDVGERCLARWRDNRRFMATINKELENGNIEIIFDDGFHWTCNISRLSKLKEKHNESLTIDTSSRSPSSSTLSPVYGAGPSHATTSNVPLTPAFHTHLFDPTRDYLGSKSERREMKRKLNIKEIFNIGQKRPKILKPKEVKPVVKKPQVKKEVKSKLEIVEPFIKNEVKVEIPDAVASIIGSVDKGESVDVEISSIKEEPIHTEENMQMEEKEEVKMEINDADEVISNGASNTSEPFDCKAYEDSVLEEEVKLEKFDKQDDVKHEEEIDRIKEVINKLEDGLNKVEREKLNSPKLEIKDDKPIEPEVKVPDESAAIISDKDKDTAEVKIEPEKQKKGMSKIKKGKKLRLLQEKKVKKQVEKVKNELEEMKKQVEEMRQQMLMKTQELATKSTKSSQNQEMPESFLLPGEWCAKWLNGQPIGTVNEIECEVKVDGQSKPALPRRSVQVEDKRLPAGWTKHMVRRSFGHSAGKWDVVLVSPDNRRFHTKNEMRNYLENNKTVAEELASYHHAIMDFGVHLKLSRRMGWISNTPGGVPDAPLSPLPAGTLSSTSPLVKRKKLSLKKKGIKVKEKKRRLTIKLKVPRPLATEDVGVLPIAEPPLDQPTLEDGYVYVGSLKVQVIDNLLRCPAEACLKNFRNNTLLQMHIKHYHRELRKMMGATPKVLDLAYARTIPTKMEERRPQSDPKVLKVKISRPKREEPKIEPMEMSELQVDVGPTTPVKDTDNTPKASDSPKLRNALVNKPVKRPRVLLPVRRPEPEQIPIDFNEDVFEDNEVEVAVDGPVLEPLDFETAISTHTVTKPLFDKKKKGEKKSFAAISRKGFSEDEEWFGINCDVDTRSSFPRSGTPDSKIMEGKANLVSSESNEDQKDPSNMYMFTENGERIKIVHMKREEIINCHCGFREEDGLMVQCELCLCWQHALCHNIQKESEVPEKYTCSICVNPRRGRRSKRFVHDQDRVYEGLLPGASKPQESLRRSHELSGNLIRIEDALHALTLKYYVATKKDHPKLYLWAEDWEAGELTYTQEKLNSDYSDLNIMISALGKENLPIKPEDMKDLHLNMTPPSEEHDGDRYSQRDVGLGSQTLLSGLLSSPGAASLDLPISTSDLERLAKSVQEPQRGGAVRTSGPQPEAAIENSACRERLLRHISRCHARLDARLDSIEAQVAELESQDPSFEDDETAEYFPRTKQTIQMLMRDLDTMEELGVIT